MRDRAHQSAARAGLFVIGGRWRAAVVALMHANRHRIERVRIGHGISRADRCNKLHQERDQTENQAKFKTPPHLYPRWLSGQ